MIRLLNGQAVNVGLASTRVTAMRGSIRLMKRAHVAPPKPPPTTTTRPPVSCAIAGSGSAAAEAPATAVLRKSRRLVRCAVMIGLLPQSFCAPYQAAMALTSSSEKPLAIRPITVEGSCPDLNASIAVTMSAGLRPLSRGTVVSAARVAAWQPEQERAPGGASAGPAAAAQSINAKTSVAATTMRVASMSEPPEMLLRADRGRAFSGFLCAPQIVVFKRQGADALARRRENVVAQGRSERRHRRFAGAAPETLAWHDDRLHPRHVGQAQHRIVMEVRLFDLSLLDGDLAVQRGREAKHDGALGLHFDAQRVDHMTAVDRRYDAVHPNLAIFVDRRFNDLGADTVLRIVM